MNDISKNKYLTDYNVNSLSLYSFLYDEGVPPRSGSHDDIISSVCDLLAILHFRTFVSGYKYLAKLITYYITDDGYNMEAAIAKISAEYGISERAAYNNISECLQQNTRFDQRASILLKKQNNASSINVDEAVELIGALYTVYYNYVTDEQ